jgi:[protein-PII] uridylyltransferase
LDLCAAVATERIGDGGPDTCSALTESLDSALQELAAGVGPNATIVALGGYGRREQCLRSDIDLMLLHGGGDPGPLVRTILYPLWDANLKVGHAVRTVAESQEAARTELETLTSLLSARLVAGSGELFGDLMTAVRDLVSPRPLASALVAQERKRRLLDPYPTIAADLKEGRGALRTHQGFWWERRRAELIGLAADEPGREEVNARATLLAIRNALHAAAGRATDRFLIDLREPAAGWLETDVHSLASRLTAALHTGDRLADRRWPDLHVEQDPMVPFGRRIFGVLRSRFSTPDEDPDAGGSALTLAVRAAGRKAGAWFDIGEEEAIRSAEPQSWTTADRAALVKLLSAGARGRTIFGRLEELGWVDREFPEWGPVATAPQLAPFHDHPVGAHLWRSADEMQALIADGGETGSMANEVGSTEELLLAAFLHDIGKARDGDHALVGGDLAAGFLRRVGFGPATVGVVADAVRHHLLLSETATRRDIEDRGVIDEVVTVVGDVRSLQLLYLLTIADLRATGTTMWNEWRGTLLRSLYLRVHQAIEAGGAPPATPDVASIMEIAGKEVDRRAVEEHVAAMPSDYLDGATPKEVLWHLDVAALLAGPAAVSADPDDPGRVLVVGNDRWGFLLAVSRAFTANGVAILDARLRTRADGIALDTFHVCDDRTGDVIDPVRWDGLARELIAALSDEHDFLPAIRERANAYRTEHHTSNPTELRAHIAGRFIVIEVRASDRIGLLTDIVEALHSEGLDIQLARIDTMGGMARDVFYARRVGGIPVRAGSELTALRGRLAERLGE